MACNCATTEQLNELYRRYGEKRSKEEKESKTYWLKRHAAMAAGILFIPAIIVFVIIKGAFTKNNKINVPKLFRLNNIATGK